MTTTIGPSADLVTTKAGPTTAVNGETITYTITTTNNGPDNATGVAITDQLIGGLTNVTLFDGGTYDSTSGLVTWTPIDIASNANAVRTISFTAPDPDNISSIPGTASSTSQTADSDTTNNSASLTTTINPVADLVTTKTGPSTVLNGQTIEYTITTTNNGPDDANQVAITDQLVPGLTGVTVSDGGTYDSTSGLVTWPNIASLVSGSNTVRTISFTAPDPDNTPSITPTASSTSPTADSNTTNNSASLTTTINPSADLVVSNTVDNSTPGTGEEIVYTITVTNNGPDDATNVVLDDDLPTGLTFVSGNTPTGTYDPTSGNWNVGNLANGATATLGITARVNSGTENTAILNTVQLIGVDQSDPDLTNNQQDATIAVRPASDLAVTKTVDNSTPKPGDTIVYTITVTNNGPDAATNVVLDDDLPTGVTYLSDNTQTGAYNSTTGEWTLGTLANQESTTLEITAQIDANTQGSTIANIAQVLNSDLSDPNPDNNQNNAQSAAIVVQDFSADLVVSKTVNNSTPGTGEEIVYTISLTNNGPDDATGVVLADDLPSGLTYLSDNTLAGTYDATTSQWNVGNLSNQATVTLQITARVDASVDGTTLQNIAEVFNSDVSDPNPNNNQNNQQSAAIVVQNPTITPDSADLQISTTVDNSTPGPGEEIVYTITVTNNGPDSATNVLLDDDLPSGVTYVSDNSGGTYDLTSGNWNVGTLANGESATLQITARVDLGTERREITNGAQLIAVDQADPDPTNNQQDATIAVRPGSDLALTTTVDNSTPNPGDTIVYTVTVTNNGPDSATNIVLDDDLPTGITYVSDNSGGAYELNSGNWTVGTLANGGSATLQITATVNADTQPGSLINTAQIFSVDQSDPVADNNNSSVSIAVQDPVADPATADLQLSISVDNPNPSPGQAIVYTLSVTNVGPSDATGIVLDDDLPTGVTYVSDNGGGAYDLTNGNWTVGSLGNGETATLQITATVNAGTGSTNIENLVEVIAVDQTDTNLSNNSATVSTSVRPAADLQLSQTVNNSNPSVGDEIVYTITVTNNGPDSATNVVLDDDLPTGVTYVSDNSNGAYDLSSGNWTVGTLANGESATLEITTTVNSDTESSSVSNTVQILSVDQSDSDSSNNQATAQITVASSLAPSSDIVNLNLSSPLPDNGATPIEMVCVPLEPIPTVTFPTIPEPPILTFSNIDSFPTVSFPAFPLEPLGLDLVQFRSQLGSEFLLAAFQAISHTALFGLPENDRLLGDDDNNLIVADDGDDILLGGSGSETPVGQERDRDRLEGGQGNDVLNGNQGNDSLYGGQGNDTIYGGKDDDWISGDLGNDLIFGDLGNDTISGGNGSENPVGPGQDDDRIFGNQGNDFINGNEGNDTIYAGQDDDFAFGGKDDDLMYGDRGNDTLLGDRGNDTIFGGVSEINVGDADGRDLLFGGAGNDFLNGNENNDTIFGGQGNDTADGGQDDDLIYGNEGSDVLFGDFGNDTIAGGNGSDNPVGTGEDDDVIFGNQGNDLINGNEGNDTIDAGEDNDIAYGGKDDDLMYGGQGNDTLLGDRGNDTIFGGIGDIDVGDADGRDLLFGGAGDDFLNGNENNDTISAGEGNDTAHGGKDDDLIYGNEGSDVLFGDLGNDTIAGGNGSDNPVGTGQDDDLIFGNQGNDLINGNEGNDTIDAGEDNDIAHGGKDDDLIYGGRGNDTLVGDRGNDTIFGGIGDIDVGDADGRDLLFGGAGDDFLNGNENNDTISAGEGNDTAHGGKDDDLIYGNEGSDVLFGDLGNDTIAGGNGSDNPVGTGQDDDLIFGNEGNDLINGNEGNDTIYGGQENDMAHGGKDDDLIYGDRGNDTIVGDLGNDTIFGGVGDIDVGDADGRDFLSGGGGDDFISGNENQDTITGGEGNDTAFGGQGNDLLHGDAGRDFLSGDLGDDTICGGIDDDTLIGGDGNDFLAGEAGSDSLTGGAGSDIFVLSLGGGADIISDYQDGVDTIGLAGTLSFDQLTITQDSDNTLIRGGDQVLATLFGVSANSLTQSDFMTIV